VRWMTWQATAHLALRRGEGRGQGGGVQGGARGGAVQVDPIKPSLKASGCERLKPTCDDLLSNFAFKSNLRRYNVVDLPGHPRLRARQGGHR